MTLANEGDTRELYAWIANDPSGIEGIVMVPDGQGVPMPLVTVERRVAEIGRAFLLEHDVAKARGATIRLVRYVAQEVVDTVEAH